MSDFWNVRQTFLHKQASLIHYAPDYRVNWLRSRAQKNRWEEELLRTEREMVWTVLYFMHQRDIWYQRLQLEKNVQQEASLGRLAYCEQQIGQWEELARAGDAQFRLVKADMPETWVPLLMSA